MAQYTISCRQVLEYQAVVETDVEASAKWVVANECRHHGLVVDQEMEVIAVDDAADADRLNDAKNDASLFATQPF